MEVLGYLLLAAAAALWLVAAIIGLIDAFPIGVVGLIALLGIGLLFLKVLRERRRNREDDHYSMHIDK
ncbi:hypothetical protein Thimo_3194 [Thioflavicoccus mobilis 8321]|uniref:Uncharacterized protein n=1 Tax=Thioflavicoccus mobilis 8321 TaxID=765912 RepID=L0H2Q6_9GAMM|nr:hypothetical protein [Thioflavicoccus mobilis]AGA91874.1 hypothetical protein Thimo_3194 [Thioflavicoccus mobilis 8321]